MTTVREYNADQNGFSPIQWNSWKTTWTGNSVTKETGSWRRSGKHRRRRDRTITTTSTTTTKQTRSGIRFRVTPVIEQQSLGSRVVSVEHIQFMRSRNIEFVCQKLKPRTKFFAFFDGIKIPKKLLTPKVMGLVKDPSTDAKTNNIPFQIGETVYDGAVGSAGFLCEAFNWMSKSKELNAAEFQQLQNNTFYGKEKKSLAYVIGIMNMILHGVEAPNIIHTNTLAENLADVQQKDRFDVILANPPFGGKERSEIQQNFPIKTSETAY